MLQDLYQSYQFARVLVALLLSLGQVPKRLLVSRSLLLELRLIEHELRMVADLPVEHQIEKLRLVLLGIWSFGRFG